MKMECNVGENDSKIRLAGGFALIIGGLLGKSFLVILVGAVLMFTGWKRSCMLYTLLGKSTNKTGGGDNTPKQ